MPVNVDELRSSRRPTTDVSYESGESNILLLDTQEKLAILDLRNVRSGYLPSVVGLAWLRAQQWYWTRLRAVDFTGKWFNNMSRREP